MPGSPTHFQKQVGRGTWLSSTKSHLSVMFAIKGTAKKISRKFMHEFDLISISGNKGEAEIDLQQIQDGVVLKLQERLSFCWKCKWCKRETTLTQCIQRREINSVDYSQTGFGESRKLNSFLKGRKIQQVVPLRIETSYKSLPQVQGQDNGRPF